MGNRPDLLDGPLIGELTKPNHAPGLSQPGVTTITRHEAFDEMLPGQTVLGPDQKLIDEFWVAPGNWFLGVEALLIGDGQAQLTLSATPSDAHPVSAFGAVSFGGSQKMSRSFEPQSTEAMHVTLTCSASVGSPVLKEVRIHAVP